MKQKYIGIAITPIILGFLYGCTSQQLYASGQGYQRNQCQRLPDKFDRDRCLSKTNTSYDDYKRETDPDNK